MPEKPRDLVLTTPQLIDAIERLEGIALDSSVLSIWATTGVAVPSARWTRRRGKGGRLYTMGDLARIRLIARLRKREGFSIHRIRPILAYVDAELPEVLRPNTKAVLVMEGFKAWIRRPGRVDVEVPSGQLRLPLVEVVRGNLEAARAAIAA